jgi:serine/threonine protein kinase
MPLAREEEFRGSERFAIQRRLGAGAFGVVYQALDRVLGRPVALKTLRDGNVEALYRLKREFRALAGIVHPNLVALYELLAHEERWFFTMELVEGINFLQYVSGERPAEAVRADVPTEPAIAAVRDAPAPVSRHTGRPERIRAALRQAVAGIQTLHRAGQLHRDIKPSNVMITGEGRLVLLDFGLATDLSLSATGSSKRSISIVGTPAYMSPEQGSAERLTESTDWYSLGVTLFEALTGRWPFAGSFVEMMWDKRHVEAPDPRDLAPGAPEDLVALCRDLLRSDPSKRPGADEILERIGGVQAATWVPGEATVSPAGISPFVGREAHLSALRSALEATRSGSAVLVRLHGASGTGKTALARQFLSDARRSGAVVLEGRCYAQESVPYKALDSLVDALSQFLKKLPAERTRDFLPRDVPALARLFPVLRRVEAVAGAKRRVLEIPDSQELRRRAFAALRELLTRLAEEHDLVLFLDDLQWGDVDSATLLGEILRPPLPPSLLIVACYRSEETATSPFLQKFLSPPGPGDATDVRDLPVGELTAVEARRLALALLEGEDGAPLDRAEEIALESGGNPFLLTELVRFGMAGVHPPELPAPDFPASRGRPAARTTLEEVIRSRVEALPEPARLLLEILAVAGRPLRFALARRAAGLEDRADEHLALLAARHLVRRRVSQDRDEIEPYHDRIRETVVAQLPPESLRTRHRSLALALEGSGTTDPEALALHFQEAGEPERAAEYATAAAARASDALAFERAARLYRLALELGSPDRTEARRALCVRFADALSNGGRSAEAAVAYLAAVEGAPAADALELRRRAAEQFLISGHIREGRGALRTVLGRVGMKLPKTPRRALLSLILRRIFVRLRGIGFTERDPTQVSAEKLTRIDICWSVAKGLTLIDPLRANDFQVRNLILSLRAGEPYRVARALAVQAGHVATGGGRARRRTERLLQIAGQLARRIDHPHAIGFTIEVSGVAAFLEGRWKAAHELSEQAGALLRERCQGVWWELDNAKYYSLASLYYMGRLSELFQKLPDVLEEAQGRGDLFGVTNVRTRLSYVLRLAQDAPEEAREELRNAIAPWSREDFFLQHWYEMLGQAEVGLYSGEPAAAWRLLQERWQALRRSFLLRVQSVLINSLSLRGRCAIAAATADEVTRRDRERLLRRAQKDARRLEREKMPWGTALARLLRAGIASARHENDESARLLESAEKDFEACDMALHAVVARRCRGELLGGAEGSALAAAADEWMRGQGVRNPAGMAAVLAPGAWNERPAQSRPPTK